MGMKIQWKASDTEERRNLYCKPRFFTSCADDDFTDGK
jgi:hypothetical protein